ncbi:MAG: cupredoxin domain-containing protein [Actinomycetota bacterium]
MRTARITTALAAAVALMAAACAGPPQRPPQVTLGRGSPDEGEPTKDAEPARPRKVDPREGGFAIGFGEYAITLEAAAIRPGPVTFVVHNGGKLVHGFEMEAEEGDEDHSGPGGGGDDDGFKIERPSFRPGQTVRIPLDLAPGLYKIECWVDDHDDLGMEILLEVRSDAPKVRQAPAGGAGGDEVAVQGFAFKPGTLEVAPGTEVTWTNQDPADHTVTAEDDSFGSDALAKGQSFSVTFEDTGQVAYFCAIHPTMKGTIKVA